MLASCGWIIKFEKSIDLIALIADIKPAMKS